MCIVQCASAGQESSVCADCWLANINQRNNNRNFFYGRLQRIFLGRSIFLLITNWQLMTFRFLAVCHTTWNKKFSRPLQMSSFCFLFLFVSFPSIQVQAHHSLCKCLFLFISIFVYLNLVHKGSPRPTHTKKYFEDGVLNIFCTGNTQKCSETLNT